MASHADHQIPSLLRRRLSHLRPLSPPSSSVQCRWSSSGRGHVSATEQAGVDGTVNVEVPVVITGASRGIRRALALGKAGCKVLMNYADLERKQKRFPKRLNHAVAKLWLLVVYFKRRRCTMMRTVVD